MTFWYLLGYSLSKAIAKTFFNYRVIPEVRAGIHPIDERKVIDPITSYFDARLSGGCGYGAGIGAIDIPLQAGPRYRAVEVARIEETIAELFGQGACHSAFA